MKKQLLELSLGVFTILMIIFLVVNYAYYLLVGHVYNIVFLVDVIISAIVSIAFYFRNRKEFS